MQTYIMYISNHSNSTKVGNRLEKSNPVVFSPPRDVERARLADCLLFAIFSPKYWANIGLLLLLSPKNILNKEAKTPDHCILGFCGIYLQFFLALSSV
jgi:hypothetical protein